MEPFVSEIEGFAAGKTIALFGSYGWGDGQWMRDWVDALLNEKGVYAEALLWREKSVLIYTYRPKQLQKELELPGVMRLLARYGYRNCKTDECISYLKKRLRMEGILQCG